MNLTIFLWIVTVFFSTAQPFYGLSQSFYEPHYLFMRRTIFLRGAQSFYEAHKFPKRIPVTGVDELKSHYNPALYGAFFNEKVQSPAFRRLFAERKPSEEGTLNL